MPLFSTRLGTAESRDHRDCLTDVGVGMDRIGAVGMCARVRILRQPAVPESGSTAHGVVGDSRKARKAPVVPGWRSARLKRFPIGLKTMSVIGNHQ